jgi:hypothetical protein
MLVCSSKSGLFPFGIPVGYFYGSRPLSYVNHRTIECKAALDSMTRELVDAGLDDQVVDLLRQRQAFVNRQRRVLFKVRT